MIRFARRESSERRSPCVQLLCYLHAATERVYGAAGCLPGSVPTPGHADAPARVAFISSAVRVVARPNLRTVHFRTRVRAQLGLGRAQSGRILPEPAAGAAVESAPGRGGSWTRDGDDGTAAAAAAAETASRHGPRRRQDFGRARAREQETQSLELYRVQGLSSPARCHNPPAYVWTPVPPLPFFGFVGIAATEDQGQSVPFHVTAALHVRKGKLTCFLLDRAALLCSVTVK